MFNQGLTGLFATPRAAIGLYSIQGKVEIEAINTWDFLLF
jgi:hypothetical protein